MLLTDSATMKEADRNAIEISEIPSTLLMTNAAGALAETVREYLAPGEKALLFCGTGNNGGDGIAAAVQLLKWGCGVHTYLVGSPEKMTEETREMERRLGELGEKLLPFEENGAFFDALDDSAVLVDALFGIGLSRPLAGAALRAVELMNGSSLPVVSCDIPSGVSADTGEILGDAVRADATVTFAMAKVGHFASPGCTCRGKLCVADIGIPGEYLFGCGIKAVTEEDVFIPPRNKTAHKGDFGKLLIVGGSIGYTGAPTFSAKAALRCGAGLVSVGVPEPIYDITAVKNDEAMPFPLASGVDGRLNEAAVPFLLQRMNAADAVVLGPGLGRSEAVTEVVRQAVENCACPLVLDADALYAIREDCGILRRCPGICIITPHEGEFALLTGHEVQDRVSEAYTFAKEHHCIVVLKGCGTVCAFPTGEIYINGSGGPALAKGGTGDVLSGMIAALICRMPMRDAIPTAVWLHGRAGDICAEELGENSVLASDVIGAIPKAMKEIQERK